MSNAGMSLPRFLMSSGPVLQRIHVRAGAEGAARPRQHDDADIVVGGRGRHGVADLALHRRRPRIHAVRPVESDGRHAILDAVENILIAHRALPLLVARAGFRPR